MMTQDRRLFIAMAVSLSATSTLSAGAAQKDAGDAEPRKDAATSNTMATYLVVYRRGPRWADGVPMRDQHSMREHFKYYMELHRSGRLQQGGGFADESGGAAVFEAADDAAAASFIAADPAVAAGTFQYELKRWRPVAWEDISKQWAERGQ